MLNITNHLGNANQNYNNRCHLTLISMTTIVLKKKTKITSVGEDVQKMELLCTVSGNVKCTATVESSMLIPQKIKNRIAK